MDEEDRRARINILKANIDSLKQWLQDNTNVQKNEDAIEEANLNKTLCDLELKVAWVKAGQEVSDAVWQRLLAHERAVWQRLLAHERHEVPAEGCPYCETTTT